MAALKSAVVSYDDWPVRQFALAAVLWGVVGMSVGILIAAQLAWPDLTANIPWLSYGRLRPLHTNAVIFAFGGCALFATSYHVAQRTGQTRLFAPALAKFTFWGWQAVIVAAAITLPMGYTQGKEYAELEWPIDILITIVWVSYAIVFFGTIAKRQVRHIYVANWFFGAFILAVALLHVVNSAVMPVSLWKSYSAYAGVQDAMVQWWYGHNAVGFFLTAGFLGMMYYYIPKQAERPVYSYRLSIVHFWALIFTYMWAGPHHLHYTALPDWTQSVGMVFSLVLLAPSWGGMINGVMTLSGAWYKLRDDAILKFLIVALSFYGMATFEGPMMSIKTVNALSHYTDWTIGHVHAGALGWVGFITMGSLYYLIPRMFGRTTMFSVKAIEIHFWIATLGVVLYIAAMWIAGVMQGLMWRAVNPDGTLVYSFIESVKATFPFYVVRLAGGLLYLSGMLLMAWNVVMTVRAGKPVIAQVPATKPEGHVNPARGHEKIETNNGLMIVLILLVVAVGGMVEIVPLFFQRSTTEAVAGLKPYTALQLAGRDVYLREGCYNCHSQMIRALQSETLRYGHYSMAGEFVYDRPFQWGSKRTGPDLARVGGKYSDEWHRIHLTSPRDLVPESNMAAYPWLATNQVDPASMPPRLTAMKRLGVPYSQAEVDASSEAVQGKSELDALIAYLQVLGTQLK
ncbi:MAG: cytochrome-c oxidase, cbb3-type subunit I [Massilia sp.]|nr:cytochrome-c oxidase, cbb3-type subunit I [Aquabacterium sp.]